MAKKLIDETRLYYRVTPYMCRGSLVHVLDTWSLSEKERNATSACTNAAVAPVYRFAPVVFERGWVAFDEISLTVPEGELKRTLLSWPRFARRLKQERRHVLGSESAPAFPELPVPGRDNRVEQNQREESPQYHVNDICYQITRIPWHGKQQVVVRTFRYDGIGPSPCHRDEACDVEQFLRFVSLRASWLDMPVEAETCLVRDVAVAERNYLTWAELVAEIESSFRQLRP